MSGDEGKTSGQNAVIYLRVSTEEQVENYSLDTQAELCKKEAERRGLGIIEVFREEGRSAKSIQGRPTLIQLLEFCRKHRKEIDAVIVYRLDRISRQTADYLAIRKKLTECDITLISASEPTGDTPTETFIETMLAGFAQMDNDVRGERAKNGLKARFISGLHNGSVPLGYVRQNGYAAKDPETFEAIKGAWELMATGTTSLRAMARILNEQGVRDKRKGYKESLIRMQTMSGIFRNKFYAGVVVSKKYGQEVPGQHAPMITEELFYRVQAVIDGRNLQMPVLGKRNVDSDEFPMRRLIKCSLCGTSFTGASSKGQYRMYAYYFCLQRCVKSTPTHVIDDATEALLKRISLKPKTSELINAFLRKTYTRRISSVQKLRDQADIELKKIYELRQSIIEKNLAGVYSDEIFKEQNKILESKIQTIQIAKNDALITKYNLEAITDFVSAKLGDLAATYKYLPLEQKRVLMCSMFPSGLVWGYPGYLNCNISPFYSAFLDIQDGGVLIGADERT
jgi:site-specific DNA recombinase